MLTRRRTVSDELHIMLEALEELHQLVRWSIPAAGGSGRLQPVECALLH
jgi:hypothetical protein